VRNELRTRRIGRWDARTERRAPRIGLRASRIGESDRRSDVATVGSSTLIGEPTAAEIGSSGALGESGVAKPESRAAGLDLLSLARERLSSVLWRLKSVRKLLNSRLELRERHSAGAVSVRKLLNPDRWRIDPGSALLDRRVESGRSRLNLLNPGLKLLSSGCGEGFSAGARLDPVLKLLNSAAALLDSLAAPLDCAAARATQRRRLADGGADLAARPEGMRAARPRSPLWRRAGATA
jgi:hypothetical protein